MIFIQMNIYKKYLEFKDNYILLLFQKKYVIGIKLNISGKYSTFY